MASKKEQNFTFAEKLRIILTNITVEPVIICYVIPNVLGGIAMQHLYLEKACRVDLQINETICDAMAIHNETGYTKENEIEVQKHVATMFSYKNALQSIIPTVLLLFIGSWSDRYNKRKPWILLPLLCELTTVMGFWITTYFFYELTVIYNVIIDGIAPVMSGGGYAFSMAIFAHISAITSEATRTVHIGASSTLMNLCFTLGSALSGVVYMKFGFYGVYIISVCMYLTGLCYGYIRVKEAPPPEKSSEEGAVEIKQSNFCVDFFDWKHVRNTLQVAFKNGKRNRKARILGIMVLVMVIIGPLHGEFVVMYLFVRYTFHWNEIDYSIFCTYYSIIHICGTVFSLMFFSKYLKLDDSILGMISSISKILSSFVYAYAPNSYIFYVAVIIEMFNGTSFIAMRSIISKLVPVDELGKIYSVFGLCEALMPLVYGPMYSYIYKTTINSMPGMFFIAGGLLTVPSVVMFGWLFFEHKADLLRDEEERTVEIVSMLQENGQTVGNRTDHTV